MDKISNILEMIDFDAGEPELIQHFVKVHSFAGLLGKMEGISPKTMQILTMLIISY